MDFTEQNIKMCEKAWEIQEQWRPCSGDVYYEHIDEKPKGDWTEYDRKELLVHRILGSDDEQNLCSLSMINRIKSGAIWLPRLDELQAMSGLTWLEFDGICWQTIWDYRGSKAIECIETKEQASILALMKHKYNKIWNGENWIEEVKKMKAIVKEIQIGGGKICHSLEDACEEYSKHLSECEAPRTKMNFTIELPDGNVKYITIRDEDEQTIAYGDFEGLPSMLDYAKEVTSADD